MKYLITLILRYYRVATLVMLAAGGGRVQAQDSSAPPDSSAVADSLRNVFLPGLGALSSSSLDSSDLFSSRFIWTDARSLGDLFQYRPGALLRDLGSPGQAVQLAVNGVDWRGVAFLLDGRPMTDPVLGTINLSEIPLEYIDHVEYYEGPTSFVYGTGGSGATMNIVTKQYNTGRPLTKIRFVQGPSEHLLTDALFSQNITRRTNLMVGIQRQTSDGRFFNSAFDSWIVRSRIRFNVSERLNLSVSDLYSRLTAGMNNGVLFDSTRSLGLDPFNEAEAVVASPLQSLTRTRRDATIAAIATLFPDTSWTTKAGLYFSSSESESKDTAQILSPFAHFSWTLTGAYLRQDMKLSNFLVDIGGVIEQRRADFPHSSLRVDRKYAAWHAHARMEGALQPSVFVRGESYGQGSSFSYGSSVGATLGLIRVHAGYGRFFRFPSIMESSWGIYAFDPRSKLTLLERHTTADLDAAFSPADGFLLSGSYTRHVIEHALLFKQSATGSGTVYLEVSPRVVLRQITGTAAAHLAPFDIRGSVAFTESEDPSGTSSTFPKFNLCGEAFYRDHFFDGALNARFGIRSRYVSRYRGVQFLSTSQVFVNNNGPSLSSFVTVDLYGIFQIGDALVSLTWENPLNKNHMTVYPYPEPGRSIRIGVNWVFLD